MKVLDFERQSGLDIFQVKEAPMPTMNKHEIMIQVAAAGLNFYDTWHRQRIPFYPYRFISNLGYECSGKVVAVGEFVSNFKEGDEVSINLLLIE